MLIELHILQNHAPSNLNRDDTGSPKTAVFGGVPRGRISSQSQKRAIRRSELFREALAGKLATRTRRLPELVRARLIDRGFSAELADIAAAKVSLFGSGGKARKGDTNDDGQDVEGGAPQATAQTMFLTDQDVAAVTDVLASEIEAAKRDPARLRRLDSAKLQKDDRFADVRPLSVDVALFGRMVTSDAFRDADAAMQVAHAISTHRIEQDYDYFTAVDDLQDRGAGDEAGADMIGEVEFNSACYYKYMSLDVEELVGNLTGARPYRHQPTADDESRARTLAGAAVEAFVRAAALVSPSGKQNSFAAHQLPAVIVAEVREARTPVSYANAFVKPVIPAKGLDLVEASIERMGLHANRLRSAFNLESSMRLVLEPEGELLSLDGGERVPDLTTLARRLREAVDG